MTTISTRQAGLHDLETIAPMFNAYRQFYEQPSDLELAREFIRMRLQNSESIILLAADSSGRSAGFCQLYPSFCSVEAKPIYTLYDLYVRPESRRGGAGKALLLAAHDYAQTVGMVRMDLTTAKTNSGAQALYESLGWVRDEVFLAYNKRVAVGVTRP